MVIQFSEIQSKDQVLIQTANSEYRFLVTDAEQQRGQLSGGMLGNNAREAVLAGVIPGSGEVDNLALNLQPGGRALFYLTVKGGVERLITSVITRVALDSANQSGKRAA